MHKSDAIIQFARTGEIETPTLRVRRGFRSVSILGQH